MLQGLKILKLNITKTLRSVSLAVTQDANVGNLNPKKLVNRSFPDVSSADIYLRILEEISKVFFSGVKRQIGNVCSEWWFGRKLGRRAAGIARTLIIATRTARETFFSRLVV